MEPKILRLPKLPQLLGRKLYKAGQTRGADDDVEYQNRVLRNSTVLIPFGIWDMCRQAPDGENYENGYIVLISPTTYFAMDNPEQQLATLGLEIGTNTLLFYQTREQWDLHNPYALNLAVATRRLPPLGGSYIARVPANTGEGGGKINRGFTTTKDKGAGIRVFEYANSTTIKEVSVQLEALIWMCMDAEAVMIKYGMAEKDAATRKAAILKLAEQKDLLDLERLFKLRVLDGSGNTVCPLCLKPLSTEGFLTRMKQAEGRYVPDITVTELNLFHIQELRVGQSNHRPYNLGWGHHHCNVVVKDSGIAKTLAWMESVLERNRTAALVNGGRE